MELRQHEDHTTLVIDGPVRLGEVPELLDHARAAAERGLAIELDLGAAEHMHTAAWQVLVALEKHTHAQGQGFRLIEASESVANILPMLELEAWLPSAGGGH
jgi:anti-anti-sigma factor